MENFVDEFKKKYEEYEIISEIGHNVWQIKLKSYEKIAILKKIDNPDIYKKLMPLKIKGIPVIYDVFLKDGMNYVIEEYISGDNLDSILASRGKFNKNEVKHIVLKLCDILSAIHSEDIIHRDIKPSNIIMTSANEIYLIDFGIARSKNDSSTKDTKHLGTEFYASPEQYGFAQTDSRSDIYSIGKLMVVLLTGKEKSEDINKIPYYRIVKRCIEVDSANRFQSGAELKLSLCCNKRVYILPLFLLIALIIFISIKNNKLADRKNYNTTADETTQAEGITETDTQKVETTSNGEVATITETTTAIPSPEVNTEGTSVKSNPAVSSLKKPGVSYGDNTTANAKKNKTEKNRETNIKENTLSDHGEFKLGYSLIVAHVGSGLYNKYDKLEKVGEKHINKGVAISDNLSVDIYTEFTDSGLNIQFNNGEVFKIPELENVETETYTDDMYVDKVYSIAYYDFDSDGISDIFVSEAVCGRLKGTITAYPLYYVNTFIRVNGDLTMKILDNDKPLFKDRGLEYDIYEDRIEISGDRINNISEDLGKYVVENGKVNFQEQTE